jgi:hypothetical protein
MSYPDHLESFRYLTAKMIEKKPRIMPAVRGAEAYWNGRLGSALLKPFDLWLYYTPEEDIQESDSITYEELVANSKTRDESVERNVGRAFTIPLSLLAAVPASSALTDIVAQVNHHIIDFIL